MGTQRAVGVNNPLVFTLAPGNPNFGYWYDPADPDFGYLLNDRSSTRYPISYLWGLANPTPTGESTQTARIAQQLREVQAAALGETIKCVYGQDRVGGDIFFGPLSTNSYQRLTMGIALSEGECDSLVKIENEQEQINIGFAPYFAQAAFTFHAGVDAPGAADADLYASAFAVDPTNAPSSATFERYPGLCHVAVKLDWRDGTLTTLPKFRWTLKGIKVLDPRLGVDGNGNPNQPRVWSDNPALILADYMASKMYGAGWGVDGINWSSVSAAANECDVLMGDGTKQFVFNGTLQNPVDHGANIDYIRAHFRCSWDTDSNGKVTFHIDKAGASVGTFTEQNARPLRRERIPTDQIPVGVEWEWLNPSDDYKPAIARYPQTAPTAADDPRVAKYNGQGTRNAGMAARQAEYYFKKRQIDLIGSFECTRAVGLKYQMGDVVTLNFPSQNLSGFLAIITQRRKSPDGRFIFDWVKYDASIYSTATATNPTGTIGSLPNPSATPPAPTGLTLTEETYRDQTGATQSRIKVAFTPQSDYPFYSFTRVKVQRQGFSQYVLADVASGPLYIPATLDVGVQYTVTVETVNLQGVPSAGTTQTITTAGKTTPPDDVAGLRGGLTNNMVFLVWQPTSDPDVDLFEIRRGYTTDTWATAQFAHRVRGLTWEDAAPTFSANTTVRYFIKAIDSANHYSVNAATFDIVLPAIGGLTQEVFQDWVLGYAPYFPRLPSPSAVPGIPSSGVFQNGNLFVAQLWDATKDGTWQRVYLCRTNVGRVAAETERSAAGYTLAQWRTLIDDPRRGGAPLWAPLPANCAGEIYVAVGSQFQRLANHRLRPGGILHAGIDTPNNIAILQHVFADGDVNVDGWPPAPTTLQHGDSFRSGVNAVVRILGWRLSTNSPFYQQILDIAGEKHTAHDSYTRLPFNFKQGQATTDGSGLVTVSLDYTPINFAGNKLVAGYWFTARTTLLSGGSYVIVVDNLNISAGTVRFKSYNVATGAVTGGILFNYELIDNADPTPA